MPPGRTRSSTRGMKTSLLRDCQSRESADKSIKGSPTALCTMALLAPYGGRRNGGDTPDTRRMLAEAPRTWALTWASVSFVKSGWFMVWLPIEWPAAATAAAMAG